MFSLTPCIYNMLEQPLECKDPTEAISKHTHTDAHTLARLSTVHKHTIVHAGALPSDIIGTDLTNTLSVNWLVGPQKEVAVIVTTPKCHQETVSKMSAR